MSSDGRGNCNQHGIYGDSDAGQKQMQHWQALLDSAGEGIWGMDPEGRCTFVNRMAVNTFGFSSEEMVGNNIHDWFTITILMGVTFLPQSVRSTSVFQKNKAFRQMKDTMFRKDGSSFVAEMSAQPVRIDGRVTGVVVTFRDVTGLRQQQEELQKALWIGRTTNR